MLVSDVLRSALQHHETGNLGEAERLYRQILSRAPQHPDALHLLGVIAHQKGQHQVSVDLIGRAISIHPSVPDYYSNLGLALEQLGDFEGAVSAYQTAMRLNPLFPLAHNNLGNTLAAQGRLDEAIAAYNEALRLQPDYADACCNLATALKDSGELTAAIEHYRAALQLQPHFPKAHSNLIFALHYHPDTDAATLADEMRRWRKRHAEPLRASMLPPANSREPNRRIKIGYVSPDLREHAVGRFLLPLLAQHDRAQFEICCYSDGSVPDYFTARLQAQTDRWRETAGLDDSALAAQIRGDRIDILIDLTLHAARNRLLVFARKPAPVQVTYLAYCGSSGLETMDYRLTDPRLDPAGADTSAYTERSVYLPGSYWCYQPVDACPLVNPLPAAASGRITFGCLNNSCKLTEPTLAVWGRLLAALPNSAVILHANPGRQRQRIVDRLAQAGVAPERVSFVGHQPIRNYCATYQRIDIGLDPFPYGGGTTTCDALWMGVPVVTLTGRTAVSRAGASVLTSAGLPEFIANSGDRYVEIARALAQDISRLAHLRATLRHRLQASPLMDAIGFTRDFEAACREMWRDWCGSNH